MCCLLSPKIHELRFFCLNLLTQKVFEILADKYLFILIWYFPLIIKLSFYNIVY